MMAQPIECTAVDMESSAIQRFVSTEGNYVSKMQIFPRVSASSLLAHGLGLVYSGFGYSFLILFSAFSARVLAQWRDHS